MKKYYSVSRRRGISYKFSQPSPPPKKGKGKLTNLVTCRVGTAFKHVIEGKIK
jgi:hypothetical protein